MTAACRRRPLAAGCVTYLLTNSTVRAAYTGSLLKLPFTIKTPFFGAGANLSLANVYDATAGAFVAPRSGVYVLSYSLVLGAPYSASGSPWSYSPGYAAVWLIVDGVRVARLARMDGSTTYTLEMELRSYYDSYNSYYLFAKRNMLSGSWVGSLAAGQRAALEVEFRAMGVSSSSKLGAPGVIWAGSRLTWRNACGF